MDRDSLEFLLAQGNSVEEIGRRFGKHPSTVTYWMDKHGLKAVNREKHGARGGIERERLEQLVDVGMTVAEIASHVDRSTATVRHWLLRYGLRTQRAQRAEQQRVARKDGLVTVELTCSVHGAGDFVLSGDGYYRCRRCRAESVVRRRRKVKELLVADAGGACHICGYDRFVGALEFHHVDPDDKRWRSAEPESRSRSMLCSLSPENACCCARTATPKSRAGLPCFPLELPTQPWMSRTHHEEEH